MVQSAHDISDGGLAVSLAECCITDRENMHGAEINIEEPIRPDCLLFGETQSRIIVTVARNDIQAFQGLLNDHGVPYKAIGTVGGDSLKINGLIDMPLTQMEAAFYDSLPKLLERY